MTKRARVTAALNGEPVDRVPVCFWHHFKPNGSGIKLAEATRVFFDDEFDLDILKIMPDIPYPFPHGSIRTVDDWRYFEPLDQQRSRFFTQRRTAVRSLRAQVGDDAPIIVTCFSPLTEALYAVADRSIVLRHMEDEGPVVHGALRTIAENLRASIADVIAAGADGVFLSAQAASTAILSESQFREFGRPYDLMALEGAVDGWLNILHVHGDRALQFGWILDYPVQVLSWSDRLAGPSLHEARQVTNKCLMGGWHEFGALSNGPEAEIAAEARDALAQTEGRSFILANGCSVPDETDRKWLRFARDLAPTLTV